VQTVGGLLDLAPTADRIAQLKPEVQWEIERARGLSAIDANRAGVVRSSWHQAVLSMLARHDVLVLPSAQTTPFPARWTWPRQVAGRTMDTYHRWMEVVVPGSMAAVPVLSIPAGLDAEGMPVGLQLIGSPRGELALLRLAATLERSVFSGRFAYRQPPALCVERPSSMGVASSVQPQAPQ
jgi:amidase